jgi:hypothetical protein
MIGPKNQGVLNSRSGILKKSITTIPATTDGDVITGKLGIGTVYGKMHFGPAGQVTHVTPKSGKFLAIPLPGAMDAHGIARGKPLDKAIFGQTFIARSKAGNLIIFGKLTYVKGEKAGQVKSDLKPLFVLKESVDVPVTITTESLRAWVRPLLGKGLADIGAGLKGSTIA